MDTFFYQDNTTTVQFDGEHIAHVSSDSASKQRYTEFDLFLSDQNEWILQGIGRTKVKGERDRYWAVVSTDINDVLEKLWIKSSAARKLLSEAFTHLSDCVCEEEEDDVD